MNINIEESIKKSCQKRLYAEFDEICFSYSIKMSPPIIVIDDVTSRYGLWNSELRTLHISYSLIRDHPWDIVVEIFKHELAHQYVSQILKINDQHGKDFHRACDRLGVEHWARFSKIDIPEYFTHWRDQDKEKTHSPLLRKAEKLLALAQSNNEYEALSAMKKVRELYEKYNIEVETKTSKEDYVTCVINHKKKRIETYQTMISSILNEYFFVRIIFSRLYDPKTDTIHKTIEIMGTKQNVLMAEYVYWFLFNNLSEMWKAYKKTTPKKGMKVRNSFYMGILSGFEQKLRKSEIEKNKAPSENKGLLVLGEQKLAEFSNLKHPKLRSRSWGASVHDQGSYQEGKAKGKSLNLNKAVHKKSKSLTGFFLNQ